MRDNIKKHYARTQTSTTLRHNVGLCAEKNMAECNYVDVTGGTYYYDEWLRSRTGTKVHAEKLDIKIWLENIYTRPGVSYRVIVLKSDAATMGALAYNTNYQPFYQYPQGWVNELVAFVDDWKYTAVYDEVFSSNNNYVYNEVTHAVEGTVGYQLSRPSGQLIELSIDIDKPITYSAKRYQYALSSDEVDNIPDDEDVYGLYVVAYAEDAAVTSDNIAKLTVNRQFTFRDI